MTNLEKKKILEDVKEEFTHYDKISIFDETDYSIGVMWGIVYTLMIFIKYHIIEPKDVNTIFERRIFND